MSRESLKRNSEPISVPDQKVRTYDLFQASVNFPTSNQRIEVVEEEWPHLAFLPGTRLPAHIGSWQKPLNGQEPPSCCPAI